MFGFVHKRDEGETLGFGMNWSIKTRRIIAVIPIARWRHWSGYDPIVKEDNVKMRECPVVGFYFRWKALGKKPKFLLEKWSYSERTA